MELPLPEFLRRVRGEEFSATEINISELIESAEEIRELHAAAGLELVAQILTAGATPSEHAASMRQLNRRAVEWAPQLGICVGWWCQILDARRAQGAEFLTVTPEFGPEPYMPMVPHLRPPVADAWEINCWMRPYLSTALSGSQEPGAKQGSDQCA